MNAHPARFYRWLLRLSVLLSMSLFSALTISSANATAVETCHSFFAIGTRSPAENRQRVLTAYLRANARFPQNAGVRAFVSAVISSYLEAPFPVNELTVPMTSAEFTVAIATMNKAHNAYQIPLEYARSDAASRLGYLWSFTSSEAAQATQALISALVARDVPRTDDRRWRPPDAAQGPAALTDFLLYNPANAEVLAVLRRIGGSIRTHLDSPVVREQSRLYRERLRGGTRDSTPELDAHFASVINASISLRITRDFSEMEQARRERIIRILQGSP